MLTYNITLHKFDLSTPYPILFMISIIQSAFSIFQYAIKFDAFREIIVSRAIWSGRREIELNSGSLPPIPGRLATLGESHTIIKAYLTNCVLQFKCDYIRARAAVSQSYGLDLSNIIKLVFNSEKTRQITVPVDSVGVC